MAKPTPKSGNRTPSRVSKGSSLIDIGGDVVQTITDFFSTEPRMTVDEPVPNPVGGDELHGTFTGSLGTGNRPLKDRKPKAKEKKK